MPNLLLPSIRQVDTEKNLQGANMAYSSTNILSPNNNTYKVGPELAHRLVQGQQGQHIGSMQGIQGILGTQGQQVNQGMQGQQGMQVQNGQPLQYVQQGQPTQQNQTFQPNSAAVQGSDQPETGDVDTSEMQIDSKPSIIDERLDPSVRYSRHLIQRPGDNVGVQQLTE